MPSLPIDQTAITIGGLGLIPTIVFLLQILKSYFPDNTPAKVWSSLALVLGVGGVFLAQYDAGGIPAHFTAIVVLIVTGLVVGTAARASYDHTIRNLAKPVIYQEMTPGYAPDLPDFLKQGDSLPPYPLGDGAYLQASIAEFVITGDDGREFVITVDNTGQLVAVPLPAEADEGKTEPLELGKSHSGTSGFSEG